MSENTICPKCGGNVAPFDYVCDYCGNVMFENVRTTDNINSGTLSFDDGMSIIKENLDALHDIPKPTFGKTIKAALRIFVALYTFGIVLIFWRRPKKRFNKDIYDKLKNIVLRNISFLKISSQGSSDLMGRIKVFEDELSILDQQIKKAITTKIVAYALVFGIFISWFVYIVNQDPKTYATYSLTAYDSVVQGNLINNIQILPDTFLLQHAPPGKGHKWELLLKLKLKQLDKSREKHIKFDVKLLLTDNKGVPIIGFKPANLSNDSKKAFRSDIFNYTERTGFYNFYIDNSSDRYEYRDTIPIDAVKFIIQADTVPGK